MSTYAPDLDTDDGFTIVDTDTDFGDTYDDLDTYGDAYDTLDETPDDDGLVEVTVDIDALEAITQAAAANRAMTRIAALAPASQTWRNLAGCRGEDPDLFFAPLGEQANSRTARDREARAKAICHACPVMADCLADAIAMGDTHGVRGAATPADRAQFVRAAKEPRLAAKFEEINAAFPAPEDREAFRNIFRGGPRSGAAPKAELTRYFVDEGLGLNEVAAIYDRDANTIRNWAKSYDISLPNKTPEITADRVGAEQTTAPTPKALPNGRTPVTQAIYDLLADGEWHTRYDITQHAVQFVPIDQARAKGESRFADADDPVARGAVNIVAAAIHGLKKKSGKLEYDGTGRDAKVRLTKAALAEHQAETA